jgi:prophage DNA circulation protein
MRKTDAQESVKICTAVLNVLLSTVPTRGRPGSDLRTAVNDFLSNAMVIIQNDQSGPPLADIFAKAKAAGITYPQMDRVRQEAAEQTPQTLGATIMQGCLIQFALATEGNVIADTTFTSRNDVEAVRQNVNTTFAPMEEIVADNMDQAGYQALIALHAAIVGFLTKTAYPLPQVVNFRFANSMPTLVTAYRLYADAGRADELRAGNDVVHPAFMKPIGIALSA